MNGLIGLRLCVLFLLPKPLPSGTFNATFCPHISGCRVQVVAEQSISLDVPRPELTITLRVPLGKTLTLVSPPPPHININILINTINFKRPT